MAIDRVGPIAQLSAYSTHDQIILVLQVGIAGVLGGVIGWERDRAGKNAGVRTHVLVCVACAFAVGLGELALKGQLSGDRTRVLHAVITGVGFLGGGMIWTTKKSGGPSGLTSAATIMLVAVIGAACGLGAPAAAASVTLLALLTLVGIRRVEDFFDRRRQAKGNHDVLSVETLIRPDRHDVM